MAIETTCPSCGTTFTLDDILQGKKVRCKRCDYAFVVGSAGGKKARATVPEDDEQVQVDRPPAKRRPAEDDSDPGYKRRRPAQGDDSEPPKKRAAEADSKSPRKKSARDEDEDEAPKRRARPERKEPIWLMVGGVAVVVLVVLMCSGGIFYFFFHKSTPAPPAPPVQVQRPPVNPPVVRPVAPQPQPPVVAPVVPQPQPRVVPPGGNVAQGPRTVRLKIQGIPDNATRAAIFKKLQTMTDGGGFQMRTRTTAGIVEVTLTPVSDPEAFASRIDFGKVTDISGRTISVVYQQ